MNWYLSLGYRYTFRHKTNAPLNRHSEALPKDLTPADGAVEQNHYCFLWPEKSLSNKDNSGLFTGWLFAIWDPSAMPQDDEVEDIGSTEGSLSKFQQSISSNHFKFQFIVGFGYTFRYKTNAPLNRHSEALPKNLTPVDGAVEQSHYGFHLPPKIIVQ